MPNSELIMTPRQARGGHCLSGGTVASGAAVCQCGAWSASDSPDPASRKVSRKEHLNLVEALRRGDAAPKPEAGK